eukprot:gnl/TRDRNA2_/TRDRNA2_173823_c0_seq4.p1 gnl/TRDRNA2_/TRDRNA2_173823_c0~~gnl/TRDRNA2_/TRDRNA2_173823_c0_seq4.p1  ORF type:complete len:453 (-),score=72.84 gnl/TRDRNA2_/TRDRNA2_173823_c0_seq4:92-1450(-)
MLDPRLARTAPLLEEVAPQKSWRKAITLVALLTGLGALVWSLPCSRTWDGQHVAAQEPVRAFATIMTRHLSPTRTALKRFQALLPTMFNPLESLFTGFPSRFKPLLAQPYEPPMEPNLEVRWVPTLDPKVDDINATEGASILPLFPFSTKPNLLHETPRVGVSEPRYRILYNDILFSGARRYLVPAVDQDTGRLAETGAILYLDDLKEVSEQTQDNVKYIGEHTVIGRANIIKVLNPRVSATRETYMSAEVEVLEDVDIDVDTTATEETARELLLDIINTQQKLGEEIRMTDRATSDYWKFDRGTNSTNKGLWGTVWIWDQFLESRKMVLSERMYNTVQTRMMKWIKENNIDANKYFSIEVSLVNGIWQLQDMPESITQEVYAIQRPFQEEIEAIESDPTLLQAVLQSASHKERLDIFIKIISKERQRLAAKSVLQAMFKTNSSDGSTAQAR